MATKIIKVPAMKFQQNNWTLYSFVIDSRIFDSIAFVSRRDEDKDTGYQRNLSEQRARDIAHYLDDDKGCIPNSILVNLEEGARYDPKSKTLRIPKISRAAWVIDGQHRMYGLRQARGHFDIVVTAFLGLDVSQQAKQFKTINSKQRGVPTSLLYDLLDLTKDGTFVQNRGHDLATSLNASPESPWYDLVDMTGSGNGLITQTRVVSALEPLISEKGSLYPYSEEQQYKILRNYFSAIKALFPKEWGSKTSVLTKAIGFSATIIILPQALTLSLARFGEFTIKSAMKILKPLTKYNFSSDNHKGWAGHPGENRLAAALAASLKRGSDGSAESSDKIRLE